MGDKTQNIDPSSDFYRRPQADAREMRCSTELEHRLELTQKIISNPRFIRAESAGLEALEEKIAFITTALRLLKELAKDEAA
jgi:hypothetical protein